MNHTVTVPALWCIGLAAPCAGPWALGWLLVILPYCCVRPSLTFLVIALHSSSYWYMSYVLLPSTTGHLP
jgi:hypothetical protein